MKEMPTKVAIVESQGDMAGKYSIAIVVEGFEEKDAAKDHARYLHDVVSKCGIFKHEVEAQMVKADKKARKHIKLLNE